MQTVKKGWTEICDIVTSNRLELLRRNDEMLNKYHEFIEKIKSEYCSVEVYIAHKVFAANLVCGGDGKWELDRKCEAWRENRIIVFRPNDFPYNFEENIAHDLLWSNRPLDAETISEIIAEEMRKRKRKEFVYFENPAHLKTIPGIFHIHVFSKIEQGPE
jgi:hypothetical protein